MTARVLPSGEYTEEATSTGRDLPTGDYLVAEAGGGATVSLAAIILTVANVVAQPGAKAS